MTVDSHGWPCIPTIPGGSGLPSFLGPKLFNKKSVISVAISNRLILRYYAKQGLPCVHQWASGHPNDPRLTGVTIKRHEYPVNRRDNTHEGPRGTSISARTREVRNGTCLIKLRWLLGV